MDDGPGMDEETLNDVVSTMEDGETNSVRSTGLGISNVHRRLKLNFERSDYRYGLNIFSKQGDGTAVSFEIPMEPGVR